MTGKQTGVRPGRPTAHGSFQLILNIERVLGIHARQAVMADFRFDPETPLVVSVELLIDGGPRVLWRIGRDLLHQGLYSVSGLGDVQIWPSSLAERQTARLQLASGDMAALFEVPLPPLAHWLESTYTLVPAGHELSGIDWDRVSTDVLPSSDAQAD
ncbi:SsgA family sporulation/cell division regulator [Actinacidiphila glaucinigra]|uniref:SsgA family sporulation/cell division regulator n=1 Tax=Actinacidiphila glaucinigra TaxID=235986 RepID=UPI00366B8949